MKRSCLVMALIILSCAAKAQFTATQPVNANYKLQKMIYADPGKAPAYKTQKAIGWVCIGLGAAIFTGAVVHDLNNLFSTEQTTTGWYVASGALVGTGVTLLIIGGKNKKRSKATAFISPTLPFQPLH